VAMKKTDPTTSSTNKKLLLRYGHPAMPMEERAKIFMPFDPFPEYRDLLRAQERRIREEKEEER